MRRIIYCRRKIVLGHKSQNGNGLPKRFPCAFFAVPRRAPLRLQSVARATLFGAFIFPSLFCRFCHSGHPTHAHARTPRARVLFCFDDCRPIIAALAVARRSGGGAERVCGHHKHNSPVFCSATNAVCRETIFVCSWGRCEAQRQWPTGKNAHIEHDRR